MTFTSTTPLLANGINEAPAALASLTAPSWPPRGVDNKRRSTVMSELEATSLFRAAVPRHLLTSERTG